MLNPLVHEAEKLGGKVEWQPSGLLPVKKTATKGHWSGRVVVIYLQFYNPTDLTALIDWSIKNGYVPMGDDGFTGADKGMREHVSGTAPACPIHHAPMRWSDRRNEWYCTKRVRGGYCDETIK